MPFKIKTFLSFFISLILIWGCSHETDDHSSHEYSQNRAGSISSEPKKFSKSNAIELQNRLKENLDYVESKLTKLEKETVAEADKLSIQARHKSEKLQNDLKRLRADFNDRIDSLKKSADESYQDAKKSANEGLEHLEDEMKQINEEMKEWLDIHTK